MRVHDEVIFQIQLPSVLCFQYKEKKICFDETLKYLDTTNNIRKCSGLSSFFTKKKYNKVITWVFFLAQWLKSVLISGMDSIIVYCLLVSSKFQICRFKSFRIGCISRKQNWTSTKAFPQFYHNDLPVINDLDC